MRKKRSNQLVGGGGQDSYNCCVQTSVCTNAVIFFLYRMLVNLIHLY